MATPTLIGMPEPPSNPDTPTDAPGTPNSTTTSLSALSTTAIKDGHRGSAHPTASSHHQHTLSSNTLEAQRADRISRLAGLERVTTATQQNPSGTTSAPGPAAGQIPGYFDQAGNPVYTTRMSTVGTASATGSTTGRTTTWASGSTKGQTEADDDEMSMDNNYRGEMDDRDRFSASAMDEEIDGDGMSDDTSLVGFGEGAGSTVSGPTYSRSNLLASPAIGKSSLAKEMQSSTPGTPISASTTATAEQQKREARMLDGITDDNTSGYVDTAARGTGVGVGPGSGPGSGSGVGVAGNRSSSGLGTSGNRSSSSTATSGLGAEAAERIMKDRLDDSSSRRPPLGSPDEAGLGKFYFEEKK